ncbi:hypothetical protein Tco_0388740, partial [Tanacetum coccineum]
RHSLNLFLCGNKKFKPPLEKEILAFLASLGHSGEIRKITDVNVNKLHQPWRSFAAIINTNALMIENKNTKKGNAMYYPRFTKLVVNFVMDKDPLIPRQKTKGSINPKRTSATLNHTKSIMLLLQERFLQRRKGSKKKADTDATTKQKPPTVPKEKNRNRSREKGTQKAQSSHARGSRRRRNWCVMGFPLHLTIDSDDVILLEVRVKMINADDKNDVVENAQVD